MTTLKQVVIDKDKAGKKIKVVREYDAPVQKVWNAWTQRELLDQWWAPKPWKAETKAMDFSEGGSWLYYMLGPDGTKHWARANYLKINPGKSFTAEDCFCDESGNVNKDMPTMHWENRFMEDGAGTRVAVDITFKSEADMQKILDTGFEEGFTMGLNNLEELLSSGKI